MIVLVITLWVIIPSVEQLFKGTLSLWRQNAYWAIRSLYPSTACPIRGITLLEGRCFSDNLDTIRSQRKGLQVSDVLLVGVTAALSALLGAGITGLVTYRATKRQADVQLEIHHGDVKQQLDEARRDRIVESRKPLLLEIRESLSRMWGLYASYATANRVIQDSEHLGAPVDPLVRERPRGDLVALTEETNRTIRLVPQISDTKLYSQVEIYLSLFNAAIPLEDQALVLDLNTARPILFAANQRIEELLAGDDPT